MEHFKAEIEVTCKCGEKMVTAPGMSVHGLEFKNETYKINNKPVIYRGVNTNLICLKCKKTTEIYFGFIAEDDE